MVIDQGLALIRKLWDAGIARRDIKPANSMVRSRERPITYTCLPPAAALA